MSGENAKWKGEVDDLVLWRLIRYEPYESGASLLYEIKKLDPPEDPEKRALWDKNLIRIMVVRKQDRLDDALNGFQAGVALAKDLGPKEGLGLGLALAALAVALGPESNRVDDQWTREVSMAMDAVPMRWEVAKRPHPMSPWKETRFNVEIRSSVRHSSAWIKGWFSEDRAEFDLQRQAHCHEDAFDLHEE
ncbi:MAG: hypothetical protein OXT69_02355 [Candidatus Poribacteria bacterium]|nr:hypothetical protein [Candidatus Poribacteria bacterium]